MAKTFLYERENDTLGMNRLTYADECRPHDDNGPHQVDDQDDQDILDSLRLGKVQVEIYKLPANLPRAQLNSVKTEDNAMFRRISVVGTSELAECVNEVLQLYLFSNFSQG